MIQGLTHEAVEHQTENKSGIVEDEKIPSRKTKGKRDARGGSASFNPGLDLGLGQSQLQPLPQHFNLTLTVIPCRPESASASASDLGLNTLTIVKRNQHAMSVARCVSDVSCFRYQDNG